MKKLLYVLLVTVVIVCSGCEPERTERTGDLVTGFARESEDWVHDAIIYEVYLRSFSSEGTFAGLEKRLPELRDLGVTVLWLMPIHPVGEENRKGVLGSPYSVRDYFDVNPEFGTMDDFKSLLSAAHDHGFKLIIDLVANHTAWDNPLLEKYPQWFVQDEEGNIIYPAGTDWWDVADLNYENPEVWEYMKEVMRFWVEDIGVDGFRCDVSELVPLEFWNEARDMLDAIKPVMMLSEGSLPEHHLHAFDITYSWNIYHNLSGIVHGNDSVTILDDLLNEEAKRFPKGSLRLRFKSNHDENAWDAPAVEKWGPKGAKAVGVLVTTMPGVPLLYNGDEVGNPKRLELFDRVVINWDRGGDYRDFYRSLFTLYNQSSALRRGDFTRIGTSAQDAVYSFVRSHAEESVLVLINLKADPVEFEIHFDSMPEVSGRGDAILEKVFGSDEAPHRLQSGEHVSVALPPYGYAIYDVTSRSL